MGGLDIQAELAATKVALANLRAAVMVKCAPPALDQGRRGTNATSRADELRRLDRLYACHSGSALVPSNAPQYPGPLYEWKSSRSEVLQQVISCLLRLRRQASVGVHMTTHFVALNYFAAIWPTDLAWPHDIPRPPKSKQEAA